MYLAKPIVIVGDSAGVERSALPKHTVAQTFCVFCVTFLYFGPYFVDIGHDFVDSVKNWLRVS